MTEAKVIRYLKNILHVFDHFNNKPDEKNYKVLKDEEEVFIKALEQIDINVEMEMRMKDEINSRFFDFETRTNIEMLFFINALLNRVNINPGYFLNKDFISNLR